MIVIIESIIYIVHKDRMEFSMSLMVVSLTTPMMRRLSFQFVVMGIKWGKP